MLSEPDARIEERFLILSGKISQASYELVKAGLPAEQPPKSEVMFVLYAYADIPFSKCYEIAFPIGRPADGVGCDCQVIAATQQYAEPFPDIPHGWKTICLMQFHGDIPALIQRMPVVDDWFTDVEHVCLCDRATWEHLKKGPGPNDHYWAGVPVSSEAKAEMARMAASGKRARSRLASAGWWRSLPGRWAYRKDK